MHLLVFIFQIFCYYGFSKIETTGELNVYRSYDLRMLLGSS
jgi:hypothetical protein